MSLQTKTIHELRGIAQALNIPFKWGDTPHDLLRAIDDKTRQTLKPAEPAPMV